MPPVREVPTQPLRQSSIVVAVRVRPFTAEEILQLLPGELAEGRRVTIGERRLSLASSSGEDGQVATTTGKFRQGGIWKLVDCVDDKMIVFDPVGRNPLNRLSETALNSMAWRKQNGSGGGGAGSTLRRRRNRRSTGSADETKFVFDKLFDTDVSQEDVYRGTTSTLLDSVLDGFNGTVFAYGATGCGKTYTVSGTRENPGIIFRTMEELFVKMDALAGTKDFELTVSFLEIYNETIHDLLSPDTPPQKLVIREDSNEKISVSNLSYHSPRSVQDVLDLVIRGNDNRTTSPTEANSVSSRSHAVLQIHIMQRNKLVDLKEHQTFGTLSIIDLAGSERAAATKNRGRRLHEGANINRSLLALGNCINALCSNDGSHRNQHVPYRDSKLTRLLKFSLGGNCKTVMIVCISPSSAHYDETLNTLKYANRAKEIKTKVIRNHQTLNRHVASYLKMITEQKRTIDELEARQAQMVQVGITNYKLAIEKIERSIEEVVGNVCKQLSSKSFQNIKLLKALTLTKRTLLQLIVIEVENVLAIVSEWTDQRIIETCERVIRQMQEQVKLLEDRFDTATELNLVVEHSREIDLKRLREMEHWDDTVHLRSFEARLDLVYESLQKSILIESSNMTEELMNDPALRARFNFLSKVLVSEDQDIVAALEEISSAVDADFERFVAPYKRERQDGLGLLRTVGTRTAYTTKEVPMGATWPRTPERRRHPGGGSAARRGG
ncbi:tubulin-dependent ATPase KIP3 KNAG_0B00520 [Huiozyma naganishii CBS 8797]|uniref:Kinesin-like protein n=1 Tax=Huiozyma naganishii (strain ATCC MYA-139 / BCRC 22969 / CBS 8797 / KCTC 17520 / NBRC 10181 / NCYC 3082 / Yp74L-3) TaxID=1071383 RepID=J7S4D9_HUIN7|nr:hypothetical protein KNAG_0B00520 [Kazachstania naganishii CBS 8797]CCK68501.1 hypothetical protein KNAG_0B00520 [Kazachstania naganishii CBS 8797]